MSNNKKKPINKNKKMETDMEIKDTVRIESFHIEEEAVTEDDHEESIEHVEVDKNKYNKTEDNPVPLVDTEDETTLVDKIVRSSSKDSKPIYHVRVEVDNIATQKRSFTDVNDAIIECNKYAGYKVFNENGIPIHVSTAPLDLSNTHSVEYAGKKYVLNEVKVFANATIKTPSGMVSGVYYLYDGINMNNRYRIVDKKSKANGNIREVIGYVAIEEI